MVEIQGNVGMEKFVTAWNGKLEHEADEAASAWNTRLLQGNEELLPLGMDTPVKYNEGTTAQNKPPRTMCHLAPAITQKNELSSV